MMSQLSDQHEPDWTGFLKANARLIHEAGVPPTVLASRDHWVDFVSHGYLDGHEEPDDFTVEELDEDQYEALKTLIAAYFGAGFEFVVPIALKPSDYMAMTREFGVLRDQMKG